MNNKRIATSVALAAVSVFLLALPTPLRADSSPHAGAQAPKAAAPTAPPKKSSQLEDDFAGLTYTEEQSAQIAKIHKETDTKRAAVAGSQTLTDEQKNAFLVGYTRLEYGEIYKVLTPEQQKMVRQRVTARHAQEKSEKKAQPRSVQTPKN